MRDIKFRAWHGAENKMYMLEKANYLGQTGIIDIYVGCAEAIWMQYTGLKDKNGVDVWESDIVDDASPDYDHQHTADCFDPITKEEICDPTIHIYMEVIFKDGGFTLEPDPRHYFSISDYPVVGNIYENGDLLTKA